MLQSLQKGDDFVFPPYKKKKKKCNVFQICTLVMVLGSIPTGCFDDCQSHSLMAVNHIFSAKPLSVLF